MLMTYPVRPDKVAEIPAPTHVDGTGRLQTVRPDQNPRYHALIEAFEARTGVPVLLNTSFNENEPICCTPEQAIDTFLRTKMDVLVVGDFYAEKPEGAESDHDDGLRRTVEWYREQRADADPRPQPVLPS